MIVLAHSVHAGDLSIINTVTADDCDCHIASVKSLNVSTSSSSSIDSSLQLHQRHCQYCCSVHLYQPANTQTRSKPLSVGKFKMVKMSHRAEFNGDPMN